MTCYKKNAITQTNQPTHPTNPTHQPTSTNINQHQPTRQSRTIMDNPCICPWFATDVPGTRLIPRPAPGLPPAAAGRVPVIPRLRRRGPGLIGDSNGILGRNLEKCWDNLWGHDDLEFFHWIWWYVWHLNGMNDRMTIIVLDISIECMQKSPFVLFCVIPCHWDNY
jgi:hypothetical protein